MGAHELLGGFVVSVFEHDGLFFELLNRSEAEVQHLWDLYLNSRPVADHRQHELSTLVLICNFDFIVLFRVWVEVQDLRDVHS